MLGRTQPLTNVMQSYAQVAAIVMHLLVESYLSFSLVRESRTRRIGGDAFPSEKTQA